MLIEKAGNFHYRWIKDLNRLLRDQNMITALFTVEKLAA